MSYKTEIRDLNMGLELLNKLRPVSFKWRSDMRPDVGFIAEEVEAANPLLATYHEGELRGVGYNQVTSVLVKSVQEMYCMSKMSQAQMDSIKVTVEEHSRRLASLESENAQKDSEIQKLKEQNAAKDQRLNDLEKQNAEIKKAVCEINPNASICK
jgi:hypothetical protein